MPWCKVTISYAGTGFSQNYKRQLKVHSDPLSQAFNAAALQDALGKINGSLPRGHQPNPVTQNLLAMSNQADQLGADPGQRWRAI